jgi:serine/threonine-protein kinase
LLLHWHELCDQGRTVTAEELCRDCPEFLPEVAERIAKLRAVYKILDSSSADTPELNDSDKDRSTTGLPQVPGYRIYGVVGRGGMAVVYRAEHVPLKRQVALKMILGGAHAQEAELTRFRREAEAVASLQHPHIIQIHEIGIADGCSYLALELVEGGSLADQLKGEPQPPDQAARLVETLARAMHYAHLRDIVHRDLKPANILLVSGGVVSGEWSQATPTTHHSLLTTHQPKITDFGLAKRLESETGPTRSGAVMGTPSYMAPEQARGENQAIGPTTDVYALGAILYELLTGRPPFKGPSSWETIAQVIGDEPVPPRRLQPKVPRDLETICLKCLQKEPGRPTPVRPKPIATWVCNLPAKENWTRRSVRSRMRLRAKQPIPVTM